MLMEGSEQKPVVEKSECSAWLGRWLQNRRERDFEPTIDGVSDNTAAEGKAFKGRNPELRELRHQCVMLPVNRQACRYSAFLPYALRVYKERTISYPF